MGVQNLRIFYFEEVVSAKRLSTLWPFRTQQVLRIVGYRNQMADIMRPQTSRVAQVASNSPVVVF